MRVDYDKDLLACLIRKAGGDLRLVEKALGRASVDKSSPCLMEKNVEEAMNNIR
jgi:hypothetical protein